MSSVAYVIGPSVTTCQFAGYHQYKKKQTHYLPSYIDVIIKCVTQVKRENNIICTSIISLVWTTCLMHRCVCIWRNILQNYDYKLHFQNLSIYHIPHVSIGTLATENLDVCTASDPWADHGKRPETGAGHAFPRQQHMCRGGLIYFCQGFLPCMMPSMDGWRDGWMTGRMDGWKKLHDHDILYYM
jgi:hypothetical protein